MEAILKKKLIITLALVALVVSLVGIAEAASRFRYVKFNGASNEPTVNSTHVYFKAVDGTRTTATSGSEGAYQNASYPLYIPAGDFELNVRVGSESEANFITLYRAPFIDGDSISGNTFPLSREYIPVVSITSSTTGVQADADEQFYATTFDEGGGAWYYLKVGNTTDYSTAGTEVNATIKVKLN